MSDSITVDTARLPLLLGELRLPTVGKPWPAFTEAVNAGEKMHRRAGVKMHQG